MEVVLDKDGDYRVECEPIPIFLSVTGVTEVAYRVRPVKQGLKSADNSHDNCFKYHPEKHGKDPARLD